MLTLLDFYADWCGPCQVMKPAIENLASEYGDKVQVEKVNIDKSQTKAQEYGVMSIPTLVLLKDGKEVDRKIGTLSEQSLKQWVDSQE